MDSSVKEYAGVIEPMTKFDNWTLERVLNEPDPERNTAPVRPLVAADYNRFVATRELPFTNPHLPSRKLAKRRFGTASFFRCT